MQKGALQINILCSPVKMLSSVSSVFNIKAKNVLP